MGLANDLLAQASLLARLEVGKPKQSSLRRAMSAAYYALFHLLVSEAAEIVSVKLDKRATNKVRRSFAHADMKKVCNDYRGATAASSFNARIGPLLTFPVRAELRNVASTFYKLRSFGIKRTTIFPAR